MLGDLGGKRQEFYEKGVALDVKLTQVVQSVASGGEGYGSEYSGVADYYLSLDSGRLGLWSGGFFGIHVQSRFGQDLNSKAGSISPVNSTALWPYPGNDNATFLSEYYITQGLSKELAIVLGRINWVGVADKSHFANNGQTQFLNMSLRNSTLLGAFFPLTAHGIAFSYQPLPNLVFTPFAVSASDQPAAYGAPDGLFNEVTVGAEVDVSWKMIGLLPGGFRPGFVWTSKDPAALDNDHLVPDAIEGIQVPTKNDNWLINLNFDQYLYVPKHSTADTTKSRGNAVAGLKTADFDANQEGIGLFFRMAITPEDRNPWNLFVSGGLGGRGVIPGRPNDRYGLGFYSMIVSNDLKNQPIISRLGSEWGLEAYYDFAITPWLQLTPDIQYIQSGLPTVKDTVVLGTRLQMYF